MANRYSSNDGGEYENRMATLRMIGAFILLGFLLLLFITSCDTSACKKEEEEQLREKLTDVDQIPYIIMSPLNAGWKPDDLVDLAGVPNGADILLRKDAAAAYMKMHRAMLENGMSVIPVCGFCSYVSASDMYEESIEQLMKEGYSYEEAADKLKTSSVVPGFDEHQLGRSIDVSTNGTRQEDFQTLEQGVWLLRNAYKYGFIFRYPESKTKQTGRDAKPWELRYVGVDAATYMQKNNLCLEEYAACCKVDCPGVPMESLQ